MLLLSIGSDLGTPPGCSRLRFDTDFASGSAEHVASCINFDKSVSHPESDTRPADILDCRVGAVFVPDLIRFLSPFAPLFLGADLLLLLEELAHSPALAETELTALLIGTPLESSPLSVQLFRLFLTEVVSMASFEIDWLSVFVPDLILPFAPLFLDTDLLLLLDELALSPALAETELTSLLIGARLESPPLSVQLFRLFLTEVVVTPFEIEFLSGTQGLSDFEL